jgi:pimeloyl-ACP methyl ester carboxylesterase
MADQLRMLQDATPSAGEVASLGDVPLVVISSADQTPDVTAAHHLLARMSSQGHVVFASKSGHWVPYDEPELIVETIREVVETVRRRHVSAIRPG